MDSAGDGGLQGAEICRFQELVLCLKHKGANGRAPFPAAGTKPWGSAEGAWQEQCWAWRPAQKNSSPHASKQTARVNKAGDAKHWVTALEWLLGKFLMPPQRQRGHLCQIFSTYWAVRKPSANSVVVLKVHHKTISCTTQSIFNVTLCWMLQSALDLVPGQCFVSKQFACLVFSPAALLICISTIRQENAQSLQLCQWNSLHGKALGMRNCSRIIILQVTNFLSWAYPAPTHITSPIAEVGPVSEFTWVPLEPLSGHK